MTLRVSPPPGFSTTVLLCADLESCGSGLDLSEVSGALRETVPAVQVQVVPDLCAHPRRITRVFKSDGTARLVLGVCSRLYPRAELQTALRKAGLDPVGVEVVDLGTSAARAHSRPVATEKAGVLLSAAVARAGLFAGSRPENLKPVLSAAPSRWSLLNLSLLEYQTIPAVAPERCRVGEGCQYCVGLCPQGALRVEDGEIRLEKSRCTGCGVCFSGCPHDAMDFPGYAPAQLAAQVAALLDESGEEPRAILFVSSDSARLLDALAERQTTYPPHWMPVEVPCLEMVPPAWLLACLHVGASAVGVLPCTAECGCGGSGRVADRVNYCRRLLFRLGRGEDEVILLPHDPEALGEALRSVSLRCRPPRQGAVSAPFQHRARAQVVLQLASGHVGLEEVSLEHPASPFGTVDLTSGCTFCGACAAVCPTGSLLLQGDGGLALTFDAALCTACGQCVPVCPEPGVLDLRRVTELERLARGRTVLVRDQYRRCVACGEPIAPGAMLRRITRLLEADHPVTAGLISRYCAACRGSLSCD